MTLFRQNLPTRKHKRINTLVIKPKTMMVSSLALSLDILEAANRVCVGFGLPPTFRVESLTPRAIAERKPRPDLVILPGLGHAVADELDDALGARDTREVVTVLRKLSAPKRVFATSCSGVFAFAAAGLLERRRVTTTWWLAPKLEALVPSAEVAASEMVVADGPIVTAGAAFAHIDLLFHLVERFAGQAVADLCRKFLVADTRQSQIPYSSVALLIASDPQLRIAEAFVHKNLHKPIGVQDLASAVGLGSRTFARRLRNVASMTPTQFLQRLRVSRAIALARSSRLGNDDIAERVGYSDATSLRRVVKRHTGKTLEAFRG